MINYTIKFYHELLGIFSGDPKNYDEYGSNICHAFEGRALAIIKATKKGKVLVTVSSPSLTSLSVEITAK